MERDRFFHHVATASDCNRRIREARADEQLEEGDQGFEGEFIYDFDAAQRMMEYRAQREAAEATLRYTAAKMVEEGCPTDVCIKLTGSKYVHLDTSKGEPRLLFEDMPVQ